MNDAERLTRIRESLADSDEYGLEYSRYDVRFLLSIIDKQADSLAEEQYQYSQKHLLATVLTRERDQLRAWAEDEQRKREKCEDQRTDERSEIVTLRAALDRIRDRALRILSGDLQTTAIGAADYDVQVAEAAEGASA